MSLLKDKREFHLLNSLVSSTIIPSLKLVFLENYCNPNSSPVDMVFKILYFLLEAGNDPNNTQYKHVPDSKDDIFRISLVGTLLETCAPHLKKKKYKNAMDKFLVFFQRYILNKTYIPLNVEFHILDVLDALSPELKKFKTYKEAHEAWLKLSKVILDFRKSFPIRLD